MLAMVMAASTGSADPGTFLNWGPVSMSIGNFIVIVTMLVLFAAALVLPFPSDGGE
jgi:hypothetical protein